jgi:GWxTD domain-containing protein
LERPGVHWAVLVRGKMRVTITGFLLAAFLIVPSSLAFGQTDFGYLDNREQIFFVDYAAFRQEAGEKFDFELYYKILTHALTFVKEGEKFRASYEIQVVVSNKINKQVSGTSTEESYVVDTYEETRSPLDFLTNQLVLSLYSGKYKLRAKLIDRNSGGVFPVEKDIDIPSRMGNKLVFSDVEFIRQLSDSTGESRFDRRGKMVIPNVSRVYGDDQPVLMFYYEIYGGPPEPQAYLVKYRVQHRSQAFGREETTTVTLGPGTYFAFDSLSLQDSPSGDYSLEIDLVRKGKERAKVERDFHLEWSFANQLKNEYTKAIEQLRYVASADEMKELKEAPEDQRLQKWLEFWKSKDPSPGTPENELKDEYLRRLKYVNQNFSLPTKEGWETDVGMIYMIYGHPDEVDKHPFERDAPTYQVWYYYQKGLTFLFVDRGDGEYELQPPYDGKYRYYRQGY